MAMMGTDIPVSARVQDPSMSLPDIGYKERDFKNRKQFLNARARAAGYKNYNQWLKARRSQGVAKKNKGGRRPNIYVITLEDYRMAEGGVDEETINEVAAMAADMTEREAIRGLNDEYEKFLDADEEDNERGYTLLNCYKHFGMTIDELKEYYEREDKEVVIAMTRKEYLIQSAYECVTRFACKNLDEFIRTIERYSGKEIIK